MIKLLNLYMRYKMMNILKAHQLQEMRNRLSLRSKISSLESDKGVRAVNKSKIDYLKDQDRDCQVRYALLDSVIGTVKSNTL